MSGGGCTLYPEISAQERLSHVDVFDLHLHVVDLSVRLLCSSEFAAGPEE